MGRNTFASLRFLCPDFTAAFGALGMGTADWAFWSLDRQFEFGCIFVFFVGNGFPGRAASGDNKTKQRSFRLFAVFPLDRVILDAVVGYSPAAFVHRGAAQ